MQNHLLKMYDEIMGSLEQLPYDIADCQDQLTELKLTLNDKQRQFDERRTDLIAVNGGWSALGKNESERDTALKAMLKHDRGTSALQIQIIGLEREIAKLTATADDLQRRYGAVCYKARLHSGLLNFLGAAGAPVNLNTEINFGMGEPTKNTPLQGRLQGNGITVTDADARAIGL